MRISWLVLVTVAALLLGGCDVKTDLRVTSGAEEAEKMATLVRQLDAAAVRERERADRLEAELTELKQTSVVRAGEKEVRFHINTPAAMVLVFAILGLTAFFIARLKYAPRE